MKTSGTIFLAFTLNKSVISDYFLALSDELIHRGFKVVIITANQKYHRVSLNTNPVIFTWPSFRPTKLQDAFFLAKLIHNYKPTMILSNFVADNWCITISKLMGVPIRIFYQHLSFANYREQRRHLSTNFKIFRKKMIYKLATHCFPVSKAMAQEAVSIFNLPQRRIKVFYNALKDPQQYFMESKYQLNYEIVCAGQLIYRKGQDVLVEALARITEEYPTVKLTLLGDGIFKQELLNLIDQHKLNELVHLAGNVRHPDVLMHMANGYLVVVPSRAEAFGYVVIEAMSVGTPVVASQVGGLSEIIRDGIDGYLVPPDDPDVLAEMILKLLANPELRDVMGKNARERFLEKFELSQAVSKQADWLENEIYHTIKNN